MINYYYYEEVNPYEIIDAKDYQISFEYVEDGISLIVNAP